jgi:hypothetical protein
MASGFEDYTWERHKLNNGNWTNWKPNIETSGRFTKIGKLVVFNANSWQVVANVTVPEGFRPATSVVAVGILASGSAGSGSPGQVNFATDGSITLSGSETKFLGTFVWMTS